jgi:3-methyladenine DNA glycosylase AlkD
MKKNISPPVQELIQIMELHVNKTKAIQMSAYMKNKFPFYGIQKPKRAELLREWKKSYPDEISSWNNTIIKMLWEKPERELHYCAMDLMHSWKKNMQKEHIMDLEYCIKHNSWWDTVDYLAGTLAGQYFKLYPDKINGIISKWNASSDLWMNRSAILFQLKYGKDTDLELLVAIIQTHKNSKEFFHQKAIGWALRTVARFNPDFVRKIAEEGGIAALSRREALKHL